MHRLVYTHIHTYTNKHMLIHKSVYMYSPAQTAANMLSLFSSQILINVYVMYHDLPYHILLIILHSVNHMLYLTVI